MSVIRQVYIRNFRGIESLFWNPHPGLNCLIGPGDSGKSTILDAIDLCLGARRNFSFTDADFFNSNVSNPLEIIITLGNLDDALKNLERYGEFLRGFDIAARQLFDEPAQNLETVISIRLLVDRGLDPDWHLYSQRASNEGLEKRLPWNHRELIAPTRLGEGNKHHFTWGRNSLLNKLAEERLDVSALLSEITRNARMSFAENEIEGIQGILANIQVVANRLGVPVVEMKALLDVASITMSHGAVSLHDNNGTPIRQLGTGSTRLLLAGLQKLTSSSRLLLVDEAEYGLEPFRINRLLNEIGAKDEVPSQQVFITTHSPYVLRELKAEQLQVVRKRGEVLFSPPFHESSHQIFTMTSSAEHQSTLRVCAEAFLANKVIVCEGKTEIGLIRGIDQVESDQNRQSIQALGVMYADGGGDSMFKRAKVFRELDYPVAIFKDSDKNAEQQAHIDEATQLAIPMFEWNHNYATEHAIFSCCPLDMIPHLLAFAVERKNSDAINAHIINASQQQLSLSICSANPQDTHRSALAQAAKNKEWFKDIAPMEELAKNFFWPNKERFHSVFSSTLQDLLDWARA